MLWNSIYFFIYRDRERGTKRKEQNKNKIKKNMEGVSLQEKKERDAQIMRDKQKLALEKKKEEEKNNNK